MRWSEPAGKRTGVIVGTSEKDHEDELKVLADDAKEPIWVSKTKLTEVVECYCNSPVCSYLVYTFRRRLDIGIARGFPLGSPPE